MVLAILLLSLVLTKTGTDAKSSLGLEDLENLVKQMELKMKDMESRLEETEIRMRFGEKVILKKHHNLKIVTLSRYEELSVRGGAKKCYFRQIMACHQLIINDK